MCVVLDGILISMYFIPLYISANAFSPISSSKLPGSNDNPIILVSRKAFSPTLVTLEGIVILLSIGQPWNALFPIVSSNALVSNDKPVNPVPIKAESSMVFTAFGIVMSSFKR